MSSSILFKSWLFGWSLLHCLMMVSPESPSSGTSPAEAPSVATRVTDTELADKTTRMLLRREQNGTPVREVTAGSKVQYQIFPPSWQLRPPDLHSQEDGQQQQNSPMSNIPYSKLEPITTVHIFVTPQPPTVTTQKQDTTESAPQSAHDLRSGSTKFGIMADVGMKNTIASVMTDTKDNLQAKTYFQGEEEPPFHMTHNIQVNTTTPRTVRSTIKTIGGVGNPSLQGIPISLGNDSFYASPSRREVITQKPIYGGVGSEFLIPFSYQSSEQKVDNPNQEFVSISHKVPSQLIVPELNSGELFTALSSSLSNKTSNRPFIPNSSPVSIRSLIDLVKHLTTQNKSPSLSPTESPYVINPHSENFPDYTLGSQLFTRPLRQASLQNRLNSQVNEIDSKAKPEYLRSTNQPFSSLIDRSGIINSDNVFQHQNKGDSYSPLSLRETSNKQELSSSFQEKSDKSITEGSNVIRNCLDDTWCGLGIVTAVALGTVSALAVPFLTPPAFGRRKRTLEYIVFSVDTANSFAKHYISMLKNESIKIPYAEKMLFLSLHDPSDNSTKETFQKIKKFILDHKENFLSLDGENRKDSEKDTSKNQIMIPENVLETINEKKSKFYSEIQMLKSNTENKTTRETPQQKQQHFPIEFQQNNVPLKLANIPSRPLPNPLQYSTAFIKTPATSVFMDHSAGEKDNLFKNHNSRIPVLPSVYLPLLEKFRNTSLLTALLNKGNGNIQGTNLQDSINNKPEMQNFQYQQLQKYGTNLQSPTRIYQPLLNGFKNASQQMSSSYNNPQHNEDIIKDTLSKLFLTDTGNQQSLDTPYQATYPSDNVEKLFQHNPLHITESNIYPYSHSIHGHKKVPFGSNNNRFSSFTSPNPLYISRFPQQPLLLANTNVPVRLQNNPQVNVNNQPIFPPNIHSHLSTAPPKEISDFLSTSHPSILLNLPSPLKPYHQTNQQNAQNFNAHNTQRPLGTISSLLQRLTKRPLNPTDSQMPTSTIHPSRISNLASILQLQSPLPTHTVHRDTFQLGTSESDVPAPTSSGKVPQLFVSDHYSTNSEYVSQPLNNNFQIIPLQNAQPNIDLQAKGFYRSVCSAVGGEDVPDSDIIRFIREKCTIFQYTGII